MPSRDSHYDLVGVIARDLGMSVEDREELAWASQMMDEMTAEWCAKTDPHRLHRLTATQCKDYDWWKQKGVYDPRELIWEAYHFPQGPAVSGLVSMLDEKHGLTLHQRGLLLHTVLDGLTAHRHFLPWRDERNRSKNRNGTVKQWVVGWLAPPIGHAEYNGEVDDIDHSWTAPDGTKVKNRSLWEGAVRLLLVALEVDPNHALSVAAIRDYSSKHDRLEFMRRMHGMDDFETVNKRHDISMQVKLNKYAQRQLTTYLGMVARDGETEESTGVYAGCAGRIPS